jgi:hypothetical protein
MSRAKSSILLLALVGMLIAWFTLRGSRSKHGQNSQSIQEPLDIAKGPTGPMGLPGIAGITGITGPTGPSVDLPSLPSSWKPTRYVTIQHIPNSEKVPVSLADIQIFDNQNVQIQIPPGNISFSSIKSGHIPLCLEPPLYTSILYRDPPRIKILNPANALDNDLRTYVSTNADTDAEFITFDLGREYSISMIVIFNRPSCTEYHPDSVRFAVDPGCRTRLNDCELVLRNKNNHPIWSERFPTPPRDVYVFLP